MDWTRKLRRTVQRRRLGLHAADVEHRCDDAGDHNGEVACLFPASSSCALVQGMSMVMTTTGTSTDERATVNHVMEVSEK